MSDVLSLPIWSDHPWHGRIPPAIEVRKGRDHEEKELLVLRWPAFDIFVVFELRGEEEELSYERTIAPMLGNLRGCAFEKLHPGEFMRMIRAQAISVQNGGKLIPDADAALWRDYERVKRFEIAA